jgi:hypothetical protein
MVLTICFPGAAVAPMTHAEKSNHFAIEANVARLKFPLLRGRVFVNSSC